MQVCARSHVCARTCGTGYKSSDFFPKKIAIVIGADRGIFHNHRSRRLVIEHSRNRQLRNHIIAVPLGIIYCQTSVVI